MQGHDGHECVIGNLWRHSYPRLITLSELKKAIAEDDEMIEFGKRDPNYHLMKDILPVGFTLKDYCDRRRRTGLHRFDFCPECGNKIDWKSFVEQ